MRHGEPAAHAEAVDDVVDELRGGQVRGAELQEEEVGVHHRLAEVALDVRHGLPLDLQTVAYPQPRHDLVEGNLERNGIELRDSHILYLFR